MIITNEDWFTIYLLVHKTEQCSHFLQHNHSHFPYHRANAANKSAFRGWVLYEGRKNEGSGGGRLGKTDLAAIEYLHNMTSAHPSTLCNTVVLSTSLSLNKACADSSKGTSFPGCEGQISC